MSKTTGIDWERVRAELNSTEWYDRGDGEQERTVFLGTVMALYPSGKYYQPWACSNLDPCPTCKGQGFVRPKVSRRRLKKWLHAMERATALSLKRSHQENTFALARHSTIRYWRYANERSSKRACETCDGLGSREAKEDADFTEALEAEAEANGLFITVSEGDPCDVLAGELREAENSEESA